MPAPLPAQNPSAARFGGLDGLRAVAVALVLVYHLFPDLLPGGFLGVDVFFVISGFLITSLLLRELDMHGRIDLVGFWRRRARRLLPALGLALLVTTSLAWTVGGDLLVGIGRQIAGAAFFVSNWVYVAAGADYFTRDNPELFRNTWSLAIEEQFYILLPLLLLLLFRLRGRRARSVLLIALGTASACWMAVLSLLGADPTRIYFGSDTHTFGLLLGAGAAALLHRPPEPPVSPDSLRASGSAAAVPAALRRKTGVAAQLGWMVAALAGLAVLGWLAATLPEASPISFHGGFQLATLASLVVVCAITRPRAWIGRALDVQPLRWVGERSYGIYLWHWPLLIVFAAAFGEGVEPWIVGLVTLVLTIVVAALSYRYVERPIRRIGLVKSCKRAFSIRTQTPRHRVVAISLGLVILLTLPATAYAIATAPRLSSAAEAIARGQAALDRQAETDENADGSATDGSNGEDAAAGSASKGEGSTKSEGKGSTEGEGPAKPAPPIAPEGRDITAIGDSVMLASLPELTETFPGIAVDAAVSRGFGAGVGIAQGASQQGSLRRVVVAGLGTNGTVQPEELDALHQVTGDRPLVLVNAYGERDWIPGVNQQLADYAAAHRGVVVADWAGSVNGVDGALAGDGIHPNPSGGEIYAEAVQRALEELQTPDEAIGYGIPRR
ncbi:acyltransferase family protein [Leucobacter ruminantium]|uniref:Acetyltransferase n=1 Tax=Leucobacter ruminantium TaxID=1289170 RepID=A0A939LUA0_9MICO|nr:acyltransferase family protein [Leucobacter ruminantium]MBO1804925.1 acetyltransferase [Leucobacter ruminantium]